MTDDNTTNDSTASGQAPSWRTQFAAQASAADLLGRGRLSGAAGSQFGGDRDLYDTLGYDKQIDIDQYWEKYLRQDIARTIVDAPAVTSWREMPDIEDDDDTENTTPFEDDVQTVVDATNALEHFKNVDRLAGIGHYGVLVIGFADGGDLSDEVQPAALPSDPEDAIAYMMPMAEDRVDRIDLVDDPTSPQFGMPAAYDIDFTQGNTSEISATVSSLGKTRRVHASRVIHVPTENALQSKLMGRPRLEAVWNRLEDLAKVIGASAEMAWRGADYGLALNADAEAAAQMSPDQRRALNEDIEEEAQAYYHGLQPFLRLAGVDVERLGGETHDPSGITDELLKLIAGETGIPKRILTGSEQGELASTQDRATFLGRISERQQHYNEPVILRSWVDMLVQYGIVTSPTEDGYEANWPDLFELSEVEQAEVANKKASALSSAANAVMAAPIASEGEVRQELFGWGPELGSEVGETGAPPPTDPRQDEGDAEGPPDDGDQSEPVDEDDDEVQNQFRDSQRLPTSTDDISGTSD